MTMIRASELFVRCLEKEGVRYIFGIPGEENEDLMFSIENSSIQFIPTRHEQGAAFMANAWGRLTGKAGVCLSTLGPGATNLLTGVADAFMDKSPTVAITAQVGCDRVSRESHQYLDIVSIFRPVTKWNTSITCPEAIPEMVRKAFKIAELEKPGATHIELPEDVAVRNTDKEPLQVAPIKRPAPNKQAIKEVMTLLRISAKPLILAGNGAIRKRAASELRELSAKYHIPVVHTFMGRGAVSDRSPESLFSMGLGFRDIVMDAVDQADLILAVGYDIAEYEPQIWNPRKNKRIIHIDFTPAETYTHYQPLLEIVGDVSATLKLLKEELSQDFHFAPPEGVWAEEVRQRMVSDFQSYSLSDSMEHFSIPGVLNILREVMGDEDLLISDVGAHKIWVGRNFPVYSPGACLISNGLATMGIALPAAIAASLADPQRKVVAVMGDGGFLMTGEELATAKHLGLKFLMILFNDNEFGQISWKQRLRHDHTIGTKLTNPDFVEYAKSFGIKSLRPRKVGELKTLLSEVWDSEELCLIEIPTDQRELLELSERVKQKTYAVR